MVTLTSRSKWNSSNDAQLFCPLNTPKDAKISAHACVARLALFRLFRVFRGQISSGCHSGVVMPRLAMRARGISTDSR